MKLKKKPTKARLAIDLMVAGAPKEIVQRARDGAFDDYESESPTPIIDLVQTCEALGLTRLAQAARDGKYDGQKWEAEAWARSPEGQATFRKLLGGQP